MADSDSNRTPREKAEAAARAHGHRGPWPPRRPAVRSAEELAALLERLDVGELSANNVAAAGAHLLDFFSAIRPEQFALLGQTLVRIALWYAHKPDGTRLLDEKERGLARYSALETTPRVRIRAVQTALKPMLKVLELAPKLARQRGGDVLLAHLLACVYAFLQPFAERMPALAAELLDLASHPAQASTAIRAAGTALDLVTSTIEAALKGQLEPERGPEPAAGAGDAARGAAQAEFEAMLAEANAKLRHGPSAATTKN